MVLEESVELVQPIEPIPEASEHQESSSIFNISNSMVNNLKSTRKKPCPMAVVAEQQNRPPSGHHDREIFKQEFRKNIGYTEWIDYYSNPFIVKSVQNNVGSNFELESRPESPNVLNDTDGNMSIPLECSLPNKDLLDFLSTNPNGLEKYIPTESDGHGTGILNDLLRTQEEEALREIKGTDEEVTVFKPVFTNESVDQEDLLLDTQSFQPEQTLSIQGKQYRTYDEQSTLKQQIKELQKKLEIKEYEVKQLEQ